MWVGTFHGICNRILRQHFQEAGLPASFQILDSSDQLATIKRVIKNAGLDLEKYTPRAVRFHINSAKDQGLRHHQIDDFDDFYKQYNDIYRRYQEDCDG